MTDIEIAKSIKMLEIADVAKKINIENNIECYGKYKAKIMDFEEEKPNGKLILVTATNPTPYGEGKTTVSIGLTDALRKLEINAGAVLREPSLGPVFGLKGGATGGGYAQVVPMEDINLHFTGDFHAITSANNLLASAIDNHIYHGNELEIESVRFKRCLDLNDRALRKVNLENRTDIFQITAASEIMTVFCLASSLEDLKRRLGEIIIGTNKNNEKIYAKDLKVEGAMTVLLKDAFKPNLVQTLENNPVIMHGGPFANISHGCNSIKATKMGLKLFDYVVTEAGFGSDLGAEKFLDIKCRKANLNPNVIVLVTTIKALDYNGGMDNLKAHIENLKKFNINIVVALNHYDTDTKEKEELVRKTCEEENVEFAITTSYKDGGNGSIELAKKVLELSKENKKLNYIYELEDNFYTKLDKLAKNIYHASNVKYLETAKAKIENLTEKEQSYPLCVAKTQYSLSDDEKKLGFPKDYTITVRDIDVLNGSEMIVVYLNNILTMPGLPKHANYENIDLDDENQIIGIF